MTKITRATIKKFIKDNQNGLYVKVDSSFDGMVDCVMPVEDEFRKVEKIDMESKYNFGICGAWFVGGNRDYFTPYADDHMIGYEISNSCGSFKLAFQR